jgi:hypothetical protein
LYPKLHWLIIIAQNCHDSLRKSVSGFGKIKMHSSAGDLKKLYDAFDESKAIKEMERWKREATKIVEPKDKALLECSRVYVMLRDIVEKEGLSCISIDCLSFSFNTNAILPLPCLAFTRLMNVSIIGPADMTSLKDRSSLCALEASL